MTAVIWATPVYFHNEPWFEAERLQLGYTAYPQHFTRIDQQVMSALMQTGIAKQSDWPLPDDFHTIYHNNEE